MEGIFIVLDGIDGAGKTTQIQMLQQALESAGESVVRSKEPTDGKWGKALRESATTGRMGLAEELDLFVKDREEHVNGVVLPALNAGKIVLVDRYFYSTVAYQGARGAAPAEIAKQMRSQFPIPDVALLLDAEPELTISRIERSRGDSPNHFERLDQLRSVRQNFLDMADSPEIETIDAREGIEGVYLQIVKVLVNGVLRKKRCAKSYDCDFFYCAFRAVGDCRWAKVAPAIQKVPVAASSVASWDEIEQDVSGVRPMILPPEYKRPS